MRSIPLTKGSSSKSGGICGNRFQGKALLGELALMPISSSASMEALVVAVNKIEELGKSAGMQRMQGLFEIVNYIYANYNDVTLDELSEKFFLSKPYLSKYIKENRNDIRRHGKNVRMKKARAMLREGNER